MKNSGSAIALGANDCKPNRKPPPVAACSKSLPPSSSYRFNEETRVKPYYTSSKNKADKLLVPSCSTDRHESKKKDDDKKDKTKIRMPQRKGGLQLWQFLYALLEDKNEQHSDLIEWTQNRKDLEFRLNDPEAIALWWGIIKHRANMTYERLSRSLRYYYDRGILKKMGGERYLYRFCIDPEEMYRHIGLSDSRPILKPMPVSVNKWVSNKLLPHQHMEQPYYTDYMPLNIPLHPSQLPPPPPYPGYHFQSAPTSAVPYQSGSSCTLNFYPSEDGSICNEQNYVPAFSQPHHSEQNYSFNPPSHDTMESFNFVPMVTLHESNLPYSGTTLAVGSVNSPVFSYGTSQIQPSQERSLSAMDVPLSDSDSDCSQNRPFSSSLPTKFHNMNDVIPQLSPTEPAPGSIYSAQSLQFECNASPTSTSGGSSELDDIIPLLESMEESNCGNAQQQASNNTSPINSSTSTTSGMYSPPPSNNKGTLESYDISTSSISSQNMSFVYSSCITQIPIPTTSTADLHNNSFRSSSWIGEENVW